MTLIADPGDEVVDTQTSNDQTTTAPAAPPQPPVQGLEPFRDPLPIPQVLDLRTRTKPVTIRAVNAQVQLHSQLPKTPMWTYEGTFPGPTIIAQRNQRLVVEWANALHGKLPLTCVSTDAGDALTPGHRDANGVLLPGHEVVDDVAEMPPWTVVHLHGSLTNGWNDGYSTQAVSSGTSQWAEYPNRQEAATLWYHDHAMDVTRLTVAAGLAGMYLIRDANEESLGLPSGEREIPLLFRDINLDTVPGTGTPNGRLLYKVGRAADGTLAPFFGTYTTVNGKIWPHLDVDPGWYRFRLLNGSNARQYTLRLVDEDGNDLTSAMTIIGTDGGLLPKPAPVPTGGLPIHCSERFDVLIDFRALAGKRVRVTTTGGGPPLPLAHCLEFRVRQQGAPDSFSLPAVLNPGYKRYSHDPVPGSQEPTLVIPARHGHVFIALLPPGTDGDPHAAFWELAEVEDHKPSDKVKKGMIQVRDATDKLRTFRRMAKMFHDQNTIFLDSGDFAIWNFLHLGGPAHPMHIHMTEFQTLFRRRLDTGTVEAPLFNANKGKTRSPLLTREVLPLEKWEEGMKDTFVIRPGTWQAVAGNFTGADGAFMYHCHILDHEDMGMMRPFMVRPPRIAALDLHGHGHAH
ncbi:MAG: multicopper oxidase domain-containing protein [Burkholderiaceae bacterium]